MTRARWIETCRAGSAYLLRNRNLSSSENEHGSIDGDPQVTELLEVLFAAIMSINRSALQEKDMLLMAAVTSLSSFAARSRKLQGMAHSAQIRVIPSPQRDCLEVDRLLHLTEATDMRIDGMT